MALLFGYVSVHKPELKIREYELYQGVYCGLCRNIRKTYGRFPCFFLNYDLVFLAMLLELADKRKSNIKKGRCQFNPFKKKCFYTNTSSIDYVSGIGILLIYNKALDDINDGDFIKRMRGRVMKLLLFSAYKKAVKTYPDANKLIEKSLNDLACIEENPDDTIDRPAETFASMMGELSADYLLDNKNCDAVLRTCREAGRWIYILDAYEDIEEDVKQKSYNPLLLRFNMGKSESPEDFRIRIRSEIDFTLTMTLAQAAASFSGIEGDCVGLKGVLGNIIFAGLPVKQRQILYGKGMG